MPRTLSASPVCRFAISLVLLLVCAAVSHAVSMDATVGFDGAAKPQVWTPVAVKLSNPGNSGVRGTLEITQGDFGPWTMPTCSANVDLPANSTKLYHIYVRFNDYGEVRLFLRRGNSLIARKTLKANMVPREDRLVVSIGERTKRLNFLSGETIQVASPPPGGYGPGPQQSSIHVGSIKSDELPDRPAAYDGVDLLVISDLSPATVSPKALQALGMWVASGGTLVVGTGPNYQTYINDFYNDLLPVQVTGTASLDTASALSTLGKAGGTSGTIAAAKSTPKPGICSEVRAQDGVPVYAKREYGAGRVIFLAFDHMSSPFRDWNGQAEFWKGLVAAGGLHPLIVSGVPESDDGSGYGPYGHMHVPPGMGLASMVEQNPSVKTPSLTLIGIFLTLYLVALVPVNYTVLKKKRRLELAWLTVPGIVIVFTLGAYAIGYTMKGGNLQIDQARFIEGSTGARFARMVTCASIFSPARRTYEMKLADPFALCRTSAGPQGQPQKLPRVYLGEKSDVEEISMAMWSSEVFESSGGLNLGGTIVSRLTLDGNRLQGKLRNNTQFSFEDCTVVYGSGEVSVGRLSKGGEISVNIESNAPGAGPQQFPNYGAPGAQPKLEERFLQLARQTLMMNQTPILLCKISGSGDSFQLRGARDNSSTLCAFRLTYQQGRHFVIQRNAFVGKVTEANADRAIGGGSPSVISREVLSGGHFVAEFKGSFPANTEITKLTIETGAMGPFGGGPGMKMGPGMKGGMPPPGMYGGKGSMPPPMYPPGYGMKGMKGMKGLPLPKTLEVSVHNWSTGGWGQVGQDGDVKSPDAHVSPDRVVRVKVKNTGTQQMPIILSVTAQGRRK